MIQLPDDRPLLMGVLNVTPDSFSDGGQFEDPEAAIRHGLAMAEEGADLIDVGGESTRPGAPTVSVDEELRRITSVVKKLVEAGAAVSIDTSKPEVAKAALDLGASVVNDVSGLREPAMIQAIKGFDCHVCIMHMQGTPSTMQKHPEYDDVTTEVRDYLVSQAELAQQKGIAKRRIWIDPGIGFGKNLQHNLELIQNIDVLTETEYPVLVGVSRKSFIGILVGGKENPAPIEERFEGTLVLQALLHWRGVKIIRTHDVAAARRAMMVATAVI